MSKTYTVVGVWMGAPVPVGVIEGEHSVEGGDSSKFPEGLWATSVAADSVDAAERAAVEEMERAEGSGEWYTVHRDDNGVRCDYSAKPVPTWDAGSGGCPNGCAAGDTTEEKPEG